MIIELGHYALVLALFIFALQAALGFAGAARDKKAWMMMARQSTYSSFWLVSIAFLALLHAYALSDFSVLNVAKNSHTLKPLIYKIAALWGNHEGSMLLWLWMLCLWSAVFAKRAERHDSLPFSARVCAGQGLIAAGVGAFILFTSNPFIRLDPPAPEGLDLNPVLQDPLLAIHPPLLYAGYVGFSIAFSFAIAALLEGKMTRDFASALRPYVLWAFSFLTVGIALGSFWAYYELGWGGFWFWDPVENASLMPWLCACALLHTLSVFQKRGAFALWALFLCICSFSMSMLGTFLVRSGVLTSVHAFAADPARGIFILVLFTVLTGLALWLFARRGVGMQTGASFSPVSREGAILVNNLFLMTALVTVFMGTLYPVFMDALSLAGVAVGTPYFVATLAPLLLPFALALGFAPQLSFGRTPHVRVQGPVAVTVVGLGAYLFSSLAVTPLALLGVFVFLWVVSSSIFDARAKKLRALPRSYFAMYLAHVGFAVMILGATGATQWGAEKTLWMAQGSQIEIAGKQVLMVGADTGFGPNYNIDRAILRVGAGDDAVFLAPEKRWYPAQGRETSETALQVTGAGIFYAVLGEADAKTRGRFVVRLYTHPLLLLIFAGAGMIALGAGLAAQDRRAKEAA